MTNLVVFGGKHQVQVTIIISRHVNNLFYKKFRSELFIYIWYLVCDFPLLCNDLCLIGLIMYPFPLEKIPSSGADCFSPFLLPCLYAFHFSSAYGWIEYHWNPTSSLFCAVMYFPCSWVEKLVLGANMVLYFRAACMAICLSLFQTTRQITICLLTVVFCFLSYWGLFPSEMAFIMSFIDVAMCYFLLHKLWTIPNKWSFSLWSHVRYSLIDVAYLCFFKDRATIILKFIVFEEILGQCNELSLVVNFF